MDAGLDNLLDGLIGENGVVGVAVFDKGRELVASKGEVGSLSTLEVVNMEKTLQQGLETGAFKYDQRRVLLRKEDDLLIAVVKSAFSGGRRQSSHNG